VKFREELHQQGGVLGVDGEDAQPSTIFGHTDVLPGNLAVPTVASFFASPKEGTPTFVDSLDDPSRKETGGLA
jgi:hypothetical protein